MDFIISLCHFCELHGPQVLLCTQAHKKSKLKELEISNTLDETSKKCQSCFPLPNDTPGFASSANLEEIIFLSSSTTIPSDLKPIIKHCCIRSISSEQFPGEWGTIYYGSDTDNCHVLACKFPLKDFHARGFQQTFCINVLTPDKPELLCNWSSITTKVNDVVAWLQFSSKIEFEQDSALLKKKTIHGKPAFFSSNSKLPKSLNSITNNENICEEVHLRFSQLLNNLMQKYDVFLHQNLPQPPLINYKHFEESDGFVKIFENKLNINVQCNNDICLNDTSGDLYPRNLYKFLGHLHFEILINHITIGNQIIVRCNQQNVIKSIIDCLLGFLPNHCHHFNYFTKEYIQSCNLLGMHLLPTLPSITRTCLILDISGTRSAPKEANVDDSRVETVNENLLLNRHYIISQENLPSCKITSPTYVQKAVQFLMNENLDNEVVKLCINALKKEWISKVQCFEKYLTMMNSVSKQDEKKLFQIIGAVDVDKELIKFWRITK